VFPGIILAFKKPLMLPAKEIRYEYLRGLIMKTSP
jgi:hypothetical protein